MVAIACFFIAAKITEKKLDIKFILNICYKCNILEKDLGDLDKEAVFLFENKIMLINIRNISYYNFSYKNSYAILETILRNNNIEIKAPNSEIKKYFLGNIGYFFVFPFFFNYSQKTIALSCTNLLLKKIYPNFSIQFSNNNYSELKEDVISCSYLFEQIFLQKKENNVNSGNITNNTNGEERRINFGTIRTINATQNNNI